MVMMVKTPSETYHALAEKGEANARLSVLKTLIATIVGGVYVGMAGLMSLGISGNMGVTSLATQKFVFAALFPINHLLVLQTGGQLFTSNTATMTVGFLEGRIPLTRAVRNLCIAFCGNMVGCCMLAFAAYYTNILTLGTADLAVMTALHKTKYAFGPVFVKAIMCNWLVSMAVFLATSAKDLTGKLVGIWFPISMFIAIGFEHSVGNMFLLPAGILAGAPITLEEVFFKNLLPATLGNLLAGAFIAGGGLSFMHGRLGRGF